VNAVENDRPLGGTCLYGRQRKTLAGSMETKKKPSKIGALKKKVLAPGQVVAVDHHSQWTPGRGPSLIPQETMPAKHRDGTRFVNLASGRVEDHFQEQV
jgi:hypothetical protein